ncbi:MAG TPA: DUF3592 domain-containing protein [Jiangellaceae bacterium]
MKFVQYLLTTIGLGLAGLGVYFIVAPPPGESGIVQYIPAAMCLFFALLMFVVWLPMVRGLDHGAVLRNGEPAMATIVAVNETGTQINERPVFKFTLDVPAANGETRRVTTKQIVSLTSIGVLRPGMVVPVRVDPKKPTKVAIDSQRANAMPGSAAMTPAGMGTPVVPTGVVPPVAGVVQSADVIRSGVSAQATVQMVSLTGMTFGQMRPTDADASNRDDPMVMLALLVNATDGRSFTAQGIHRVPEARLSGLTPGRTVPVAYLPNDPSGTTCVDWNRL